MPSPSHDTQDRSSRRHRRSHSPSESSRRRRRSRSRDGSRSRRHEKSSRRREADDDTRARGSRRRSLSPDAEPSERSKHRRRSSRSRERSRRSRDDEKEKEKEKDRGGALRKAAGPLPSQEAAFSGDSALVPGEEPVEKQKPNFQPTGLLAAASNSIAQADGTAIVLKYHEPGEARKPPAKDAWKLFVFKGEEVVDTIELSGRSCWLVGKERAVVDLPAEHPSVSRQHAVFQFRYVEKRNEFGDKLGKVRPYLIDLESGNGTILNGDKVESARYLELRDKDVIKFGHSTREYVLMLPPK